MTRKVESKREPGAGPFNQDTSTKSKTPRRTIKSDPDQPIDGEEEHELVGDNVAANEDGDDFYDDESQEEAISSRFIVKELLPTPTSAQRNLGFLLKLLQENLIDLNPDYQREVVWTPDRQVGLINSLMQNFYVPPVIFNIVEKPVSSESEETQLIRICVDGKQRLSSVLRFVQGLIPCTDANGYRWWWNRVGGRNRNLLDDDTRDQFLAKQFICIEYINLSDDEQEDLFGRVQKGMVLSEAEKLKAMRGPWQDMALDFEEDFKGVVALSKNQRASGFRNILAVMAQVTELQTIDTEMDRRAADTPALQSSASSLKKFVTNGKNKHTTANINLMAWIFRLWNKIRLRNPEIFQNNNFKAARNFAPLEFLTVGVLLYRYGHFRTLPMLKGDILAMRFYLRERNHDLRTNAKCWRDCWEFVEHLESLRGDSGPWTDHDIPPALGDDGTPNRPTSGTEANASGKRGNGNGHRKSAALNAILTRAEQQQGTSSQRTTPRKVASPKAKPTTSASITKPKLTAATPAKGNPTPSAKGKQRTIEADDDDIASSSTSNPAMTPRIPKFKSSLPHHAPPPKGPTAADTIRVWSSLSSSDGSSDDLDDGPPRPAHQHRAPPAPMTIGNGSTPTTASAMKRKRLSVKTTDGASQLLSKRKRCTGP